MADLIQTPQTNTEKFVSRTAVAGRHEGAVADYEGRAVFSIMVVCGSFNSLSFFPYHCQDT